MGLILSPSGGTPREYNRIGGVVRHPLTKLDHFNTKIFKLTTVGGAMPLRKSK